MLASYTSRVRLISRLFCAITWPLFLSLVLSPVSASGVAPSPHSGACAWSDTTPQLAPHLATACAMETAVLGVEVVPMLRDNYGYLSA